MYLHIPFKTILIDHLYYYCQKTYVQWKLWKNADGWWLSYPIQGIKNVRFTSLE